MGICPRGESMARKLQSDKWLFLATLALVCVSVVMVYSASAVVALDRYQQPYYYVIRQVMWALLGLAVLCDRHARRLPDLPQRAGGLGGAGLVGLLLVAVLFARPINGSRRWFGIGGFGIQPSELAKVAAVLFTAVILDRRMARINELKYALSPIALIVGGLAGLILLEPDFGTAAAMALVVGVMVMAAGLSYRYIVGLLALAIPLGYLVLISAPYRMRRADSPSGAPSATRWATASTCCSRSSPSAAAAGWAAA